MVSVSSTNSLDWPSGVPWSQKRMYLTVPSKMPAWRGLLLRFHEMVTEVWRELFHLWRGWEGAWGVLMMAEARLDGWDQGLHPSAFKACALNMIRSPPLRLNGSLCILSITIEQEWLLTAQSTWW